MSEWAPLCDDWLKDFIADSNPMSPINHYDDFEPEMALVSPTTSAEPCSEVTSQCDWLSDLLQGLPEVPKNSPETQEFSLLDTVFEDKNRNNSMDNENNMDNKKNTIDNIGQGSTNNSNTIDVNSMENNTNVLGGLRLDKLEKLDKIEELDKLELDKLDVDKPEASAPINILPRRPSCRVGKNHDLFFHKVNEKLHMLKENNCLTPRALETVFNTKDVLKDCNLGRCSKHKNDVRPRAKRSKRRRSSIKHNNSLAPAHIKTELPETPISIDFFDSVPQSASNTCAPNNFAPNTFAPTSFEASQFSLSPPYSSAGSPRSCSIPDPLTFRSSCNVTMNS